MKNWVKNNYKYTFDQISKILKGKIISNISNFPFHYFYNLKISIDSRSNNFDEDSIFIALKGHQFDGHDFVKEAYSKGCRNFIIEEKKLGNDESNIIKPNAFSENANFILVQNTTYAFQQLANYHRSLFDIPSVIITGSNGKTIVKEWLSESLSKFHSVAKNPKSYNSQIGVPLSVMQIKKNHDYAIFEAGISKPNEMSILENIIKPHYGILTNIGTAHDNGFISRNEKILEKLNAFKNCKRVYINFKDKLLKEISQKTLNPQKIISYSPEDPLTTYQYFFTKTTNATLLTIQKKNVKWNFQININYNYHIDNIITCLIFLIDQNYDINIIKNSIKNYRILPMRLQLKKGINDSLLIDDSYSNDLISLDAALEYQDKESPSRKKTLIISDFENLESKSIETLKELNYKITKYKINEFIGIGNILTHLSNQINCLNKSFYHNKDTFIKNIEYHNFTKKSILVKGSRNFKFEKIICYLEKKTHISALEVNLDALLDNFNIIKSVAKPKTKILGVVKAQAYGVGANEVAKVLQNYGKIDYLGVAYIDEGIDLRKNGITTPILVFNPTQSGFDALFKYNLEPTIHNKQLLENLILFKNNFYSNSNLLVHIKIDSGMNRFGFNPNEIITNIKVINSNFHIKSIFSHLAASDNSNFDEFTKNQISIFNCCYDIISTKIGYKPLKHILNTNGILRFPCYQYDMIRVGIGLYGIGVSKTYNLKPVNTLKTTINQIKIVKKLSSIGYNRGFLCKKKTKIGIICLGYADGLPRLLGENNAEVLVNSHFTKYLGRLSMDSCAIDLTDIEASIGDEVEIFGENIDINKLSKQANMIPYEILSKINPRIKRVYYKA